MTEDSTFWSIVRVSGISNIKGTSFILTMNFKEIRFRCDQLFSIQAVGYSIFSILCTDKVLSTDRTMGSEFIKKNADWRSEVTVIYFDIFLFTAENWLRVGNSNSLLPIPFHDVFVNIV